MVGWYYLKTRQNGSDMPFETNSHCPQSLMRKQRLLRTTKNIKVEEKIHQVSELWTCPDFEWFKVVQMSNGPLFTPWLK